MLASGRVEFGVIPKLLLRLRLRGLLLVVLICLRLHGLLLIFLSVVALTHRFLQIS